MRLFFLLTLLLFHVSMDARDTCAKVTLIGKTKTHKPLRLCIKALEKGLPYIEERVYNPYEKRADRYGGVPLDKFVEKFGDSDVKALKFTAIDDYETTIRREDWEAIRIILSTQMNGHYIAYAQKGPLRIVFPDFDPAQERYRLNLPNWIWMIKTIEFK